MEPPSPIKPLEQTFSLVSFAAGFRAIQKTAVKGTNLSQVDL